MENVLVLRSRAPTYMCRSELKGNLISCYKNFFCLHSKPLNALLSPPPLVWFKQLIYIKTKKEMLPDHY